VLDADVLQLNEAQGSLTLQVSLDGYHFSEGQFPPSMRIENRVSHAIAQLNIKLMTPFRHIRKLPDVRINSAVLTHEQHT